MYNQNMEVKSPFIKVCPPQSNQQYSPRPIDSPKSSRFQELSKLYERKIGRYIVKTERLSDNSIDGYTAIFDENLNMLFEG